MTTTTKTDLRCSFCGRTDREVDRLVAGPGVHICDACVALCQRAIDDNPPPSVQTWDELDDDGLLAEMVRIHAGRRQIDEAVAQVVARLRSRTITWARIGAALGMTRQSAWERFAGEE
jgi:ATP-dependent Clp protease ATP-binding subunit ClpX